MKIGIFGDSFADNSGHLTPGGPGWSNMIKDEYADVNCHALSGSSMWYSRNLFLDHYKNYDVIIFSFTSNNRWPNLPKHLQGRAWNIGYQEDQSQDDFLDIINPYFWEVFPNELTSYINSAIHREVVDLCKENDKYLISVIPFELIDEDDPDFHMKHGFTVYPNNFPCITGLNVISHREQIKIDDQLVGTCKILFKIQGEEIRGCHLSPANNRIIRDWMIDCINTKKYNEHFNGCEYTGWELNADEEHTAAFFKQNPIKEPASYYA